MTDPDWNEQPIDYLLGYTEGMEIHVPTKIHKARPWRDRTWHFRMSYASRRTEFAHWCWAFNNIEGTRDRTNRQQAAKASESAKYYAEASRIIKILIKRGLIDMGDLPDDKKEKAETALTYTASVVLDGKLPHDLRLKAARILLDFTAEKPTARTDISVKRAEDFLDLIADDETDDETDTDTEQTAH